MVRLDIGTLTSRLERAERELSARCNTDPPVATGSEVGLEFPRFSGHLV